MAKMFYVYNINVSLLGLIVTSVLLSLICPACCRLELDFSKLSDPINLRRAEHYGLTSIFDQHSTSTFTLRMSQDTMQKIGVGEGDLPSPPSRLENPYTRSAFVEAVLRNVSHPLLPEGQELLQTMLAGPLQSAVVTLQPTDDQFDEMMLFLDAYKAFWNYMGEETVPKVEDLASEYVPSAVQGIVRRFVRTEPRRAARRLAPMEASHEYLRHLTTSVFNVPRNQLVDKQNATAVRVYVRRQLEDLGLLVLEHNFASYETDFMVGERLEGTNLIALLPGARFKTPHDRPVVVGAHIDTVVGSPGYDDNGSGMAALMETARMIATSGCKFDNTVVFVAFDLEEMGTQGSMMFVKDFVPRVLKQELGMERIYGAFVLDCIGNWDPEPQSQDLPEGWHEYLPQFVERTERNDRRGDFISLIYRNGIDAFLANRFSSYFSRLDAPEFRLEALAVDSLGPQMPSVMGLKKHFNVLRSDHVRFWYPNGEDGNGLKVTIPAVLITDTGPFRGRLRQCYHSPCDVHKAGQDPNVSFLAKTTEAVAWTTADLAGGQCGPRGRLGVRQLFRLTSSFSLDSQNSPQDEPDSEISVVPNDVSDPVGNEENEALRKVTGSEGSRTAHDPTLASLTNALEMLHFLGVVPSIEELTENQLRTPRRTPRPGRARGMRVFKRKLPINSHQLYSTERRGSDVT